MGSLPRTSVLMGERVHVPTAPLPRHLTHSSDDVTALVYCDETQTNRVSYGELQARSNALSKVIAERARVRGANRDGDFVVAICMQPTHKTIVTLLATWKAGAAYVPMDPTFPQARITHILKDSEPALIVYDETAKPSMFDGSGVPALSFEELAHEARTVCPKEPTDSERLAPLTAETIAIVLYTSGSTGVPKGVRLDYSAICNRLWWQFKTFPFADSETHCVSKTALTFVDSVAEIWGPLLHGRTLVILSKESTRDPEKLVRVLDENQIQRLVLVPTLLRSILMYLSLNPSERPLTHLKLWVCSGETLSKELASQFFKYFGDHNGYKLADFYGSTEVMGDVTYYVLEHSEQLDLHATIPIGMPLHNCAVYLLDPSMQPAHSGTPGEVWVAGANLARGYVGGQAPEKFLDNPHAQHPAFGRLYRTGDFGAVSKGALTFAGRADAQVKVRGHRVDLLEVERAVAAVDGVEKAVVLCYGVETGNPEILAFVTIAPAARMAESHVEAALKDSLTHYMMPQVIVIESFPLLVNGKIDRQSLLKMYENTNNNDDATIPLDIDYSGVQPEELVAAKALFETVGAVLGRSARGALSLRSGFYELGGNSLNSIFVITQLKDQGFYIKVSDFLYASNLGEVLSRLSTAPPAADSKEQFTAVPMRDGHRDRVIEMTVSSFYEKAELEQFLKHEIAPRDYADALGACWEALLEARLSVVLTDASGEPVAVALNFDARDEPELKLAGGLDKIMTFLEFVESQVRDTLLPPGKGAVLHGFMMSTASTLAARDNVAAIRALEHATMRVARQRGFKGVFTTNTSPLTQQLGTHVLGFQTLLDYQINQYIDQNGERVFGAAPDDMRVIVCWKPVEA